MPQLLPTAERVLQVFEIFAREKRALNNSEMARFLDVADSSCSDLLYTLRMAGYLVRAPKTRLFQPTTKLLTVAREIAGADPMQLFASEVLDAVSRETGESSLCGYLEGHHVKIYACHESPRALRYVLAPGSLVDINVSALGKALLGALAPAERDALLEALPMERITSASVTDRATLQQQIEASAADGVYSAIDEGSDGVAALAVAGHVGDRLIAISVVGPTTRLLENRAANAEVLRRAKQEYFVRPQDQRGRRA